MKRINSIILLVISVSLLGIVQADLQLVDGIECVVCGPEANTPFTNTDISWKRNLDSQPIRIEQRIQQEIMKQQANSEKMPIDPAAASKYVESLKKQNNLDDNDLADLFDQIGCTFIEGIELLNNQYMYELFMHQKFKSQLVVTDDVIREYYEQNPEWVDGWCEISITSIPINTQEQDSRDKAYDLAIDIISGKKSKDILDWSAGATLNQDEIAKDKHFIFDMEIGQINMHEMPDSIELYQMIKKEQKRLKSLDERRFLIIDKLNAKKLESLFDAYNQQVRKYFDIINLNENVKVAN